LYSFLRDSKSAKILLDGFNAPIGQFSSKIHLCHALGLIEDDEYKQLEGLRKIRNKFAHSFENIDFDTQQIKDLINGNLIELPQTHQHANYFITGLLILTMIYSIAQMRC
jgi:DNA-binding MltR family transcriptional regulator